MHVLNTDICDRPGFDADFGGGHWGVSKTPRDIDMTNRLRSLEDYLKEPYSRVLISDEETGTFTAQILEFPGCVAEGKTVQDAYQNLEKTAQAGLRPPWTCTRTYRCRFNSQVCGNENLAPLDRTVKSAPLVPLSVSAPPR